MLWWEVTALMPGAARVWGARWSETDGSGWWSTLGEMWEEVLPCRSITRNLSIAKAEIKRKHLWTVLCNLSHMLRVYVHVCTKVDRLLYFFPMQRCCESEHGESSFLSHCLEQFPRKDALWFKWVNSNNLCWKSNMLNTSHVQHWIISAKHALDLS